MIGPVQRGDPARMGNQGAPGARHRVLLSPISDQVVESSDLLGLLLGEISGFERVLVQTEEHLCRPGLCRSFPNDLDEFPWIVNHRREDHPRQGDF